MHQRKVVRFPSPKKLRDEVDPLARRLLESSKLDGPEDADVSRQKVAKKLGIQPDKEDNQKKRDTLISELPRLIDDPESKEALDRAEKKLRAAFRVLTNTDD